MHIDDVPFISKKNFYDHLKDPEKVLQKLAKAVLKVNAEDSFMDLHKLNTSSSGLERTG